LSVEESDTENGADYNNQKTSHHSGNGQSLHELSFEPLRLLRSNLAVPP
jgi:hypothetical protein